jgi:Zn-finger nucleic acid-binding protein
MQCPKCAVPLTMSERQGIEIDYCPQCRGVWLDRGELDKVIERSTPSPAATAPPPHPGVPPQQWGGHEPGYGRGHGHDHYPRHKR